MLFGEHSPSIDSQYRISIPAKFRNELGEQFVIVMPPKKQRLRIYSNDAWSDYIRNLKKSMKLGEFEDAQRAYYSKLVEAVPDSLGRVRVPKDLWEKIGVSFAEGGNKEIVVVGCGEFGEIWSKPHYDAYTEAFDEDALIEQIERCTADG